MSNQVIPYKLNTPIDDRTDKWLEGEYKYYRGSSLNHLESLRSSGFITGKTYNRIRKEKKRKKRR